MARPTIDDIARSAGVSKGAVSFALNNRPGVSESTRARIMSIASDMGWLPNAAARSLAGTRSGAIGLVLARPVQTLGAEPFFMQVIAGIESELAIRSQALVFQVVDNHAAEIATYRRWWAERRVDGVLVVDPHLDDDRAEPLTTLGLPAVFIGIPRSSAQFAGVWSDDAEAMRKTLQHLADLGHVHIARVAGSPHHDHVAVRTEAFHRWAGAMGLTDEIVVATDYSAEQGAQATRALLSAASPPTAIIYDNDVMALAGLSIAQKMGKSVPDDLSLVAWDDSILCQVSFPTITAIHRDIFQFGAIAARLLLDRIDGGTSQRIETPSGELILRGSTARHV